MKKANGSTVMPDEWEGELPLFSLDGLLCVDQMLSVNTTYLIVSLVLMNGASGNRILLQKPLTNLQMRVLLPLLKFPHFCSHEVLLTSLSYSYQKLLAGLFSSDRTAREEWVAAVQETQLLLERAQEQGTWRKELKQLYNILSELRSKLRPFGLGIAISTSRSAYALIALPTSQ